MASRVVPLWAQETPADGGCPSASSGSGGISAAKLQADYFLAHDKPGMWNSARAQSAALHRFSIYSKSLAADGDHNAAAKSHACIRPATAAIHVVGAEVELQVAPRLVLRSIEDVDDDYPAAVGSNDDESGGSDDSPDDETQHHPRRSRRRRGTLARDLLEHGDYLASTMPQRHIVPREEHLERTLQECTRGVIAAIGKMNDGIAISSEGVPLPVPSSKLSEITELIEDVRNRAKRPCRRVVRRSLLDDGVEYSDYSDIDELDEEVERQRTDQGIIESETRKKKPQEGEGDPKAARKNWKLLKFMVHASSAMTTKTQEPLQRANTIQRVQSSKRGGVSRAELMKASRGASQLSNSTRISLRQHGGGAISTAAREEIESVEAMDKYHDLRQRARAAGKNHQGGIDSSSGGGQLLEPQPRSRLQTAQNSRRNSPVPRSSRAPSVASTPIPPSPVTPAVPEIPVKKDPILYRVAHEVIFDDGIVSAEMLCHEDALEAVGWDGSTAQEGQVPVMFLRIRNSASASVSVLIDYSESKNVRLFPYTGIELRKRLLCDLRGHQVEIVCTLSRLDPLRVCHRAIRIQAIGSEAERNKILEDNTLKLRRRSSAAGTEMLHDTGTQSGPGLLKKAASGLSAFAPLKVPLLPKASFSSEQSSQRQQQPQNSASSSRNASITTGVRRKSSASPSVSLRSGAAAAELLSQPPAGPSEENEKSVTPKPTPHHSALVAVSAAVALSRRKSLEAFRQYRQWQDRVQELESLVNQSEGGGGESSEATAKSERVARRQSSRSFDSSGIESGTPHKGSTQRPRQSSSFRSRRGTRRISKVPTIVLETPGADKGTSVEANTDTAATDKKDELSSSAKMRSSSSDAHHVELQEKKPKEGGVASSPKAKLPSTTRQKPSSPQRKVPPPLLAAQQITREAAASCDDVKTLVSSSSAVASPLNASKRGVGGSTPPDLQSHTASQSSSIKKQRTTSSTMENNLLTPQKPPPPQRRKVKQRALDALVDEGLAHIDTQSILQRAEQRAGMKTNENEPTEERWKQLSSSPPKGQQHEKDKLAPHPAGAASTPHQVQTASSTAVENLSDNKSEAQKEEPAATVGGGAAHSQHEEEISEAEPNQPVVELGHDIVEGAAEMRLPPAPPPKSSSGQRRKVLTPQIKLQHRVQKPTPESARLSSFERIEIPLPDATVTLMHKTESGRWAQTSPKLSKRHLSMRVLRPKQQESNQAAKDDPDLEEPSPRGGEAVASARSRLPQQRSSALMRSRRHQEQQQQHHANSPVVSPTTDDAAVAARADEPSLFNTDVEKTTSTITTKPQKDAEEGIRTSSRSRRNESARKVAAVNHALSKPTCHAADVHSSSEQQAHDDGGVPLTSCVPQEEANRFPQQAGLMTTMEQGGALSSGIEGAADPKDKANEAAAPPPLPAKDRILALLLMRLDAEGEEQSVAPRTGGGATKPPRCDQPSALASSDEPSSAINATRPRRRPYRQWLPNAWGISRLAFEAAPLQYVSAVAPAFTRIANDIRDAFVNADFIAPSEMRTITQLLAEQAQLKAALETALVDIHMMKQIAHYGGEDKTIAMDKMVSLAWELQVRREIDLPKLIALLERKTGRTRGWIRRFDGDEDDVFVRPAVLSSCMETFLRSSLSSAAGVATTTGRLFARRPMSSGPIRSFFTQTPVDSSTWHKLAVGKPLLAMHPTAAASPKSMRERAMALRFVRVRQS